jgi:hypothetical protein
MTEATWNTDKVSVRTAFVAMVTFLERYYAITRADDIGALLGGLSLLPDGDPADPGFKTEWIEAVKTSISRADR